MPHTLVHTHKGCYIVLRDDVDVSCAEHHEEVDAPIDAANVAMRYPWSKIEIVPPTHVVMAAYHEVSPAESE